MVAAMLRAAALLGAAQAVLGMLYPGMALDDEEEELIGRPQRDVRGEGRVDVICEEQDPRNQRKMVPVVLHGKRHILTSVSSHVQMKRIPEYLLNGILWVPDHYFSKGHGFTLSCPEQHPEPCAFFVSHRICEQCLKYDTEEHLAIGGLDKVLAADSDFERITKCNSLVTASMDIAGDLPTGLYRLVLQPGAKKEIVLTQYGFHFGVWEVSKYDCSTQQGFAHCEGLPYCRFDHKKGTCSFNHDFCKNNPEYAPPEKDIFPIYGPRDGEL